MGDVVIRVENVSKEYRLGVIGYTTLSHDLQSRWARFWGKEDPNAVVNSSNSDFIWNERFLALKDISFDVQRGEIVGIIGKNGAGKSTLLKILSRVTYPTSGSVKVKGRIASLLEVGTGFHPELTGRENVFLNGAILGMSKLEIEEKFDEIVKFAEIDKFIDTPVKRYSSGMYVRLAFSVAAHLEPEILLVDEVLAVGDTQFQKKCLGKMGDVAKEGRTVLFVSHNMNAIIELCTKGVCLNRGVISYIGSQKDAVDYYLKNTKQNQKRDINLSLKKRHESILHSPLRIINIKILGGDEFLVFKIGEPIHYEITFQSDSIIDGIRIGIGINTILGQRLCTFHSPLNYFPFSIGQNKICLTVETTQMKPGTYIIDVGARSGKVTYDAIVDVASFEISSIDINKNLDDSDNYGLISIKHSWSY